MVAVALAHAAAEAAGDLDETMATLGDDPVYELLPRGVVLRGRDAARRYYEHFFANVMPRVTDFDLRSEWVTDEGVLQEYTLFVEGLGTPGTGHSIIGILTFGDDGTLSGERIYASDALLEFMFGSVLDEAEPR
jgi:hypothetical protein